MFLGPGLEVVFLGLRRGSWDSRPRDTLDLFLKAPWGSRQPCWMESGRGAPTLCCRSQGLRQCLLSLWPRSSSLRETLLLAAGAALPPSCDGELTACCAALLQACLLAPPCRQGLGAGVADPWAGPGQDNNAYLVSYGRVIAPRTAWCWIREGRSSKLYTTSATSSRALRHPWVPRRIPPGSAGTSWTVSTRWRMVRGPGRAVGKNILEGARG